MATLPINVRLPFDALMNSPSKAVYSSLGSRLRPPEIMRLMNTALENPGLLSLAAGFTDTATLPVEDVTRAVNELAARTGPPEFLQYGTSQGRPRLRELLAARTSQLDGVPGGAVSSNNTLIGNGSQQLLYLAMQVLCDPGDIVLVEQPTYFVFLEMLAGLGVQPVSLPARPDLGYDFEGIERVLSALEHSGDFKRIKAIYLMTYFANPSGVCRDEGEKAELARLFLRFGLTPPIIEDAAYRELWFDEAWPHASVLSTKAWEQFSRLYLGTLTKPYATGLKIGYAHASEPDLLQRMTWAKGHHDFGTTNFNQAIMETVLGRGSIDDHLKGLRRSYADKMHCLNNALEASGLRTAGWEWASPRGGLNLWARAPEGVNTDLNGQLWNACIDEGVYYVPGSLCFGDTADSRHVRLSYGVLDHESLRQAADKFARAAAIVSGIQRM